MSVQNLIQELRECWKISECPQVEISATQEQAKQAFDNIIAIADKHDILDLWGDMLVFTLMEGNTDHLSDEEMTIEDDRGDHVTPLVYLSDDAQSFSQSMLTLSAYIRTQF